MVRIDVDNTVFLQQKKILESALSSNPKTQKVLQKLIRKALMDIRPSLVAAARSSMRSDPRGAAQGIRSAVYKKILGGQVNILNMRRRAGKPISYEPPRKLESNPHQRGGNRVVRSKRTDDSLHYGPHDRQWILRFINSGTVSRTAGTRGGRLSGNRGSIIARDFFGRSGISALTRAAENLATMIDTELEAVLNKKSTA